MPIQTTYLSKELEDVKRSRGTNLLMMRVDPEAGSWPSNSIIDLGKLANECLEEDRENRLDMNNVSLVWSVPIYRLCPLLPLLCSEHTLSRLDMHTCMHAYS